MMVLLVVLLLMRRMLWLGLLPAVLRAWRGPGPSPRRCPLRGRVGCSPDTPLLVDSVHGCLEVGHHVGIDHPHDVGRNHRTRSRRDNGFGNRVLEMRLEPLDQLVDAAVDLVPVPEPVWDYRDVLDARLLVGLVGQDKLSRELLGGTEEVRNAFGILVSLVS